VRVVGTSGLQRDSLSRRIAYIMVSVSSVQHMELIIAPWYNISVVAIVDRMLYRTRSTDEQSRGRVILVVSHVTPRRHTLMFIIACQAVPRE